MAELVSATLPSAVLVGSATVCRSTALSAPPALAGPLSDHTHSSRYCGLRLAPTAVKPSPSRDTSSDDVKKEGAVLTDDDAVLLLVL